MKKQQLQIKLAIPIVILLLLLLVKLLILNLLILYSNLIILAIQLMNLNTLKTLSRQQPHEDSTLSGHNVEISLIQVLAISRIACLK